MVETIISRTPVAKVPQTLGGSIKGIFLGFLLIPAALWLCYYGETRKEISAYVQRTAIIAPESAPSGEADVRFSGVPVAEVVSDTAYGVGNAWYINRRVEEYKQVEKTRRVKRDGQEYEERYLTNEWVSNPNDSATFSSSQFKFGPIVVTPSADSDWLEHAAENILMKQTLLGKMQSGEPALGSKRVTITGIKAGSPLFVAGHLSGGTVRPNEDGMMVISAMSEAATIKSLKSGDRMIYWVIKGIAFCLLYGGFMVLLGPLTWALSWIPILGHLGRGIIGFGMFVISGMIITGMSVLIHFFWWVVGGFVAMLILLVVAVQTMMKKKVRV
jgi:hypothetical protein